MLTNQPGVITACGKSPGLTLQASGLEKPEACEIQIDLSKEIRATSQMTLRVDQNK
jgi:hypothetical protein